MESSICNLCWEFCYEVATADPKGTNEKCLIMNLPKSFLPTLKNALSTYGFSCSSMIFHGQKSVIVKFEKFKQASLT